MKVTSPPCADAETLAQVSGAEKSLTLYTCRTLQSADKKKL